MNGVLSTVEEVGRTMRTNFQGYCEQLAEFRAKSELYNSNKVLLVPFSKAVASLCNRGARGESSSMRFHLSVRLPNLPRACVRSTWGRLLMKPVTQVICA